MQYTVIVEYFHCPGTTQSKFHQIVFDKIFLMQRIHNERLHAYSLARKSLNVCLFFLSHYLKHFIVSV